MIEKFDVSQLAYESLEDGGDVVYALGNERVGILGGLVYIGNKNIIINCAWGEEWFYNTDSN